MRLFEVDLGSARDVLAVLQGQANRQGQPSTLPFATVMKLIQPFGLGISTPDGLIALKNQVDPAGDVIADILDNGSVVLKTDAENPNKDPAQQTGGGPAVDAMASSNAKQLSPNI
jgi:hypothetical protein